MSSLNSTSVFWVKGPDLEWSVILLHLCAKTTGRNRVSIEETVSTVGQINAPFPTNRFSLLFVLSSPKLPELLKILYRHYLQSDTRTRNNPETSSWLNNKRFGIRKTDSSRILWIAKGSTDQILHCTFRIRKNVVVIYLQLQNIQNGNYVKFFTEKA